MNSYEIWWKNISQTVCLVIFRRNLLGLCFLVVYLFFHIVVLDSNLLYMPKPGYDFSPSNSTQIILVNHCWLFVTKYKFGKYCPWPCRILTTWEETNKLWFWIDSLMVALSRNTTPELYSWYSLFHTQSSSRYPQRLAQPTDFSVLRPNVLVSIKWRIKYQVAFQCHCAGFSLNVSSSEAAVDMYSLEPPAR